MVEKRNDFRECDQIQGMGYSSMIFALTRSCFLGMGTFIIFNISKVNAYISVAIGMLLGFLSLFLFLYIDKNKGETDIIDSNIKIFGKLIGFILNFILNIMILIMASVILYNISEFFITQYIPDSPILYIEALILVPLIYAASKNIGVISRISQIIMYVTITIFLLSFFGIGNEIKLNNVLPILADGIKTPVFGAIVFMLFNTAPIFLLTIISKKDVKESKHKVRNIIVMYILSNILLFFVIFATTALFGYEVVELYKYPEYMALKKFSLVGVIERVENTLACSLYLICLCLC